jgi:serine/threonine-protein kinase HipA
VTFGVFADSSPDRWGRLLMRRRLERAQRAGRMGKPVRLHESDYLLGVHDEYRSGALRLGLGGARPKASVLDPQGQLWIAKFPSVLDEHDVGAWELVVQTLAKSCGLALGGCLFPRPDAARRRHHRA